MRRLLILLSLMLMTTVLYAQEDDETWQATLFDNRSGEVTIINMGGVLSTVTVEEYAQEFGGSAAVSPDGKTLIFHVPSFEDTPSILKFADLEADTCCVELADPLPDGSTTILREIVFSPDSTELAAVFLNDQTRSGILAVIDFTGESPEVTTTLDLSELTGGDVLRDSVFVHVWTEEGIQMVSSGDFYTWNPQTDELSDAEPTTYRGAAALVTGEVAGSASCDSVPRQAALANTTLWKAGNAAIYRSDWTSDETTIIYFDPETALKDAGWGMNGEAVLVLHLENAGATIVARDGTQTDIVMPEGDHLLMGGTPEGWLVFEDYYATPLRDSYRLLHLTLEEDKAVYSEIAEITFSTFLLTSSPLVPEDAVPFAPDQDAVNEDGLAPCPMGG